MRPSAAPEIPQWSRPPGRKIPEWFWPPPGKKIRSGRAAPHTKKSAVALAFIWGQILQGVSPNMWPLIPWCFGVGHHYAFTIHYKVRLPRSQKPWKPEAGTRPGQAGPGRIEPDREPEAESRKRETVLWTPPRRLQNIAQGAQQINI